MERDRGAVGGAHVDGAAVERNVDLVVPAHRDGVGDVESAVVVVLDEDVL